MKFRNGLSSRKTDRRRLLFGTMAIGIVSSGILKAPNADAKGVGSSRAPDWRDPFSSGTPAPNVRLKLDIAQLEKRYQKRIFGRPVSVRLAGGGGGGGGGGGDNGNRNYGGGGGGGGGSVSLPQTFTFQRGRTYEVQLGSGGGGGIGGLARPAGDKRIVNGEDGKPGETTMLIEDGKAVLSIFGGSGGRGGISAPAESKPGTAGDGGKGAQLGGDGGRGGRPGGANELRPSGGKEGKITGLSRSTLYRLAARKELPLVKVCGRTLIARTDLEDLIARMRTGLPMQPAAA